jgi:hypothetical protein
LRLRRRRDFYDTVVLGAAPGICPGLARLDGIDPQAGTLTEVYVALWEQEALREALKRAGRLNMNLGLLCTASTPSGTMAVMEAGFGLSLEKSNELAQKIMRKVDELLPTVDKQVPFPEAYDLETAKPKPKYEAGMLRVMDELGRLGMPLK